MKRQSVCTLISYNSHFYENISGVFLYIHYKRIIHKYATRFFRQTSHLLTENKSSHSIIYRIAAQLKFHIQFYSTNLTVKFGRMRHFSYLPDVALVR